MVVSGRFQIIHCFPKTLDTAGRKVVKDFRLINRLCRGRQRFHSRLGEIIREWNLAGLPQLNKNRFQTCEPEIQKMHDVPAWPKSSTKFRNRSRKIVKRIENTQAQNSIQRTILKRELINRRFNWFRVGNLSPKLIQIIR